LCGNPSLSVKLANAAGEQLDRALRLQGCGVLGLGITPTATSAMIASTPSINMPP
jgi:uncharacterized protein YjeT (DUF2065 family)